MTKRSTKSALLSAVLALVICFTALVGTTFAWFTDSVTSANNKIVAGNLDVDLFLWDANGATEITESSKPIFGVGDDGLVTADDRAQNNAADTLWEPGKTQVVYLSIKNNGSLDLKYKVALDVRNPADGKDLYKALQYAITGDAKYGDTAPAWNGGVSVEVGTNATQAVDVPLAAGAEHFFALSVHMLEEAGNEYQKGSVEFDIKVLATQLTSEEDSFNDQYDKDAEYDNKPSTEWHDPSETEYVLYTADELAGFAKLVNEGTSFSGKTVKLAANVDLGNRAWEPIGSCDTEAYFQGTFDGQGYTISGLNVDRSTDGYMYSTAGLFGWVDAAKATIKNVKVDGATVKGSHWVGVIAGFFTGEISGCTVSNATVIGYNVNDDANGDKIGGIVGYVNTGAGKLDGNTVINSTVKGYRDVGGLAGAVATTNTVTNNKVENVVVTHSADYAGAIVSPKTAVVVDATNVAANVSVVKSATATTAAELKQALSAGSKEIYVSGQLTLTEGLTATDVTLIGADKNAAIAFDGHNITGGGKITYQNLKLSTIALPNTPEYGERYDWHGGIDYMGHTESNYVDCEITGVFTTYSGTVNATGCTFNYYVQDGDEQYGIFQYATGTVNVKECTFMYGDRAIKVYSHGPAVFVFNIEDSKFVATEDFVANKPLINIDSTHFTSLKLNIKNITVDSKLAGVQIHNGANNAKVTVTE